MHRFRFVLAVLALVVVGAGCGAGADADRDRAAVVFHEERVAPRIVDLNIRSPALGTTVMVRLLTPDGWTAARKSRRWPVLYLLHGCCDSYESWTRSTDIEELPQLRKVLVVMPEAGPVGFYTNWHGEPGPAWETFHLTEVRQLLERDYGAGSRRAVAGLSMGGLGAMGYAARHPGLFRAAASFSGLLHPLQDVEWLLGLFSASTPDPRAIWGDPASDRAIWARHDPTELADHLRGIPLFVSAGNGRPGPLDAAPVGNDTIEPRVLRESRAFVSRLRQLHIPVHADFYGPGTHAWPYWQRELKRALPTLLRPAAPLASRAAVDQDRAMRTKTISTIMAVGAVALTPPVAAAQAPDHGSCAAFGGNVAGLATTLGPVFGATASGVASSGPAAFPTLVVAPEQAALCEPRP